VERGDSIRPKRLAVDSGDVCNYDIRYGNFLLYEGLTTVDITGHPLSSPLHLLPAATGQRTREDELSNAK
jgi:hypothetical protein